jgi:hypothetical protein
MAKLGFELENFMPVRRSLFDRNFTIAEAERYFQITKSSSYGDYAKTKATRKPMIVKRQSTISLTR